MGYFDLVYQSELSAKARNVYRYLKDRAGVKNSCYPRINIIAKDLGISRSTVKRALRELQKNKWIEKYPQWRENGSCQSNLYIIKETAHQ